MPGRTLLALLLPLAALGCLSFLPPEVEVYAPVGSGEPMRISLAAQAEEREALAAALERAGFSIAASRQDAPFRLTARFGRGRSWRGCGSLRDVEYELRRGSLRIAEVKGRGWTGTCPDNILVDMGQELAGLW